MSAGDEQTVQRHAPALLCREPELAWLAAWIRDVAGGRGRAGVLLAGAGLGKTALVAQAARGGSGQELQVLTARGRELEEHMPFGVVRQLFERALRDMPEGQRLDVLGGAAGHGAAAFGAGAGGETADPLGVLHGLYWLAANLAERAPLLILVDDAHCADPESLRWLAYLTARLSDLRLGVLIAARPHNGPAHDVVAAILAQEGVSRLELGPLDADAQASLVRLHLGGDVEPVFIDACGAATGGNPFYLRELLRAAASDGIEPDLQGAAAIATLGVPEVARSILLRLGRLGPDVRGLAVAVAMLGAHADLRHAAALAELSDARAAAAWDALVHAGILVSSEPLEFIHPIVRAAIDGELAPGERGRLHRRAADLLEADGAPIDAVAAHALACPTAGDGRVGAWLREAARAALGAGAPEAAVHYLRRALEQPPPADERAQVRLDLALALLRTGSPDAAQAFAAAADGAPEALRLTAERWRGYALAYAGCIQDAVVAFDEAAALATENPDLALHLSSTRDFYALWWADDPDFERRRRDALARAVGLDGDTRGERRALAASITSAIMTGAIPAPDALALSQRAARGGVDYLDREDGDETAGAVQLAEMLTDQPGVVERFQQREREALERGWRVQAAAVQYGMAAAQLRQGQLLEAEASARTSWRVIGSLGDRAGTVFWWSAAVLVSVLLARGGFDEVGAIAAAIDLDDAPLGIVIFPWPAVLLGELALARGRPGEGIERLLAAGAWLESRGFTNPAFVPWRASVAPALAAAGRHDEARAIIGPAVARARDFGSPWALGMALRAAGTVEQGQRGIALLHEATAVLEPSPCRLEHAHALLELGSAMRRDRQRAAAREPLRVALDLAVRCGSPPLAQRARAELAETGAHPRREALTGVASLTPAERRVARLAAEGRTNPEIAQALFVTRKTVEAHLGHVYAKLDVSGRGELAAASNWDAET